MKLKTFSMILFGLVGLVGMVANDCYATIAIEDRMVTIEIKNRNFEDTINIISEQLQLDIKYDQTLSKISVSGNFEKVPLGKLLQRILKSNSTSIVFDEGSNEIVIRSLGSKDASLMVAKHNTSKSNANPDRIVDFETGMTLSEFNNISQNQKQRRLDRLADLNSIVDLETGLTRSEYEAGQEERKIRRLERLADPNHIVNLETGLVRAEYEAGEELREQIRDKRLTDPSHIVDSETGLTRAEYNEIVKIHKQNRQKRLAQLNM